MSAGGRLRVGFVVYPGFTGLDLVGPHEVLVRIEEAECLLAGSSLEPVASSGGLASGGLRRHLSKQSHAGRPSRVWRIADGVDFSAVDKTVHQVAPKLHA